jgi:hypothetical protein
MNEPSVGPVSGPPEPDTYLHKEGDALLNGPGRRARWYRVSISAMALVLAMFSPAAFVFLGWFTDAYQDTAAASEVSHRLHEVAFGILFTIALVGALSQWRSPRENLAGLLQLTATVGILAVAVTATVGWDPGLLLYLIPLAAVLSLRPTRVRIRSGPMWWYAGVLTVLAVNPFLDEIVGHLERAASGAQNHTTHWGAMAAFAGVLLALGLVVTLRINGYRLAGVTLGLSAVGYGLAALVFPYDASSHRPAFSMMLIVWGAAWVIGLRVLDRPKQGGTRPVRAIAGGALALFAFVAGVIWAEMDTPPNVPHRPNPAQPMVTAVGVDRGTCLGCHQTGDGGAPMVPHEIDRVCDDGPCWGGRTDCAGCHRIDPALGGPATSVETGQVSALLRDLPTMAEGLSDEELALIENLVVPP